MGKGKSSGETLIVCCGIFAVLCGLVLWIVFPSISWSRREASARLPQGSCDLAYGINHPDYTSMIHNTFCMDNVTATWQQNGVTQKANVSLCSPPPGVWTSTEEECRTFQQGLPSKQTGQQVTTCFINADTSRAYVNLASKSHILGILVSGVLVATVAICFVIYIAFSFNKM